MQKKSPGAQVPGTFRCAIAKAIRWSPGHGMLVGHCHGLVLIWSGTHDLHVPGQRNETRPSMSLCYGFSLSAKHEPLDVRKGGSKNSQCANPSNEFDTRRTRSSVFRFRYNVCRMDDRLWQYSALYVPHPSAPYARCTWVPPHVNRLKSYGGGSGRRTKIARTPTVAFAPPRM